MQNFRAYQHSVTFYRAIQSVQLPVPFTDQLRRAASGIVLTLAEGSGRRTRTDQNRFFTMAYASVKEIKAIIDLNAHAFNLKQIDQIDHLGAMIYKLIHHK